MRGPFSVMRARGKPADTALPAVRGASNTSGKFTPRRSRPRSNRGKGCRAKHVFWKPLTASKEITFSGAAKQGKNYNQIKIIMLQNGM
jgi:hypothetical protein